MKISAEAVDAAELAAHLAEVMWKWSEMSRDESRAFFTEVLEAAAPYLKAEAWDECASNLVDEYGTPLKVISNGNPYRSAVTGK